MSANGHVFFVNKDVVEVSKHLKTTLASNFLEGTTKEVKLNIDKEILEVCIKYMHYKLIYQELPHTVRPQFHIDAPIALDVLNAAVYLQC